MRKVVAHLIMTLDGVVQLDAVHEPLERLRETVTDFFALVAQEDAMLMGRITYQEWADYWPTSSVEPFASHINGVQKYVVSQSLTDVPWGTTGNTTLLKGDLADEVMALKQLPGKTIGVHGSPTLVESLIHANVLDELRLEIYPVIAGTGARLFQEGRPSKELQLANTLVTSGGVLVATYKVAND